MHRLSVAFDRLSTWISRVAGSWQAFVAATTAVLLWFACGFFVGFTGTLYQLSINTGTTIVTFLMVFLLQHTQNRDTLALHIKIDELIRVTAAARDDLRGIECLPETEIREKAAQ